MIDAHMHAWMYIYATLIIALIQFSCRINYQYVWFSRMNWLVARHKRTVARVTRDGKTKRHPCFARLPKVNKHANTVAAEARSEAEGVCGSSSMSWKSISITEVWIDTNARDDNAGMGRRVWVYPRHRSCDKQLGQDAIFSPVVKKYGRVGQAEL